MYKDTFIWEATSVTTLDTAMGIVFFVGYIVGLNWIELIFTPMPSSWYLIDCILGLCVRMYQMISIISFQILYKISFEPRTNTCTERYQSNTEIDHGFLSQVNFTIIRDWILQITNITNGCLQFTGTILRPYKYNTLYLHFTSIRYSCLRLTK